MPNLKPVHFGIVGCGSASVPVCEAMVNSPFTELLAVYDVNDELARDLSRRFSVEMAESLDEVLDHPGIDAVYIAVPHDLLAPLTQRVLAAGKHALTEKPLALSLDEVDRLIDLANKQQVALGVFYEMRYAPAHALARDLIHSGAIGKITGVQIQTLIDKPLTYWHAGYSGRSIHPWRSIAAQAGGGVVLMNTSHILDALSYVTGLEVSSVAAEVATLVVNVEVEDTASAVLRFDNGALGSLIAGAHIPGAANEERCFIYGTEGQIHLPDPYGSDALRVYLKRAWGNLTPGHWHSLLLQPISVYGQAIEDFARAVQSGGCVPIDAHAARQVLAVVLAMYRSAAEKRSITIS
jgi:predicted dehydrogenase